MASVEVISFALLITKIVLLGRIAMKKSKILLVDDDKNICILLDLYLRQDGHTVIFAHDGQAAIKAFQKENPDLVVLDLMLPIMDGWKVLKYIRQESQAPVIMLTAVDACEDKVTGLDLGADDYVVKPFDPREVAARVRAHLRKQIPPQKDDITAGNLVVNSKSYEVVCGGKPVELTPKEFQLLEYMLRNRNIVLSRDQILESVWGYDYFGETRTVDMHIKRLRQKLKSSGSWRIRTIYGIGYKFEV